MKLSEEAQELLQAKQALEKFKIESDKELKKLRENHANTHKHLEEVCEVTSKHSDSLNQNEIAINDNYGRMRQICHYLYCLEEQIKKSVPIDKPPMLPFSPEGQPLKIIGLADFRVIE